MSTRIPIGDRLHLPRRTGEALASGLGRGRLRSPDVSHPFHGVVAREDAHDDVLACCLRYEPLLLPGQFFSHRTAAALWGMPLPPASNADLDVAVAWPRTPPRRAGVRGRSLGPTGLDVVHGFPVAAPADAWAQLGSLLSREDLVAAGDGLLAALHREPLATLDELAEAAARYAGRPGAAQLRWALPRLRQGAESRPESLLRLLIARGRLPEPVVAHPVDVGPRVLHPDLAWPELRIGIEYEGDGHRTDRATWLRDIERRELFAAAHWRSVQVTSIDLFVRPAALISRLRAVREDRAAR